MANRTRIQFASGISFLFVVTMVVILLSMPSSGYAPKSLLSAASQAYQKEVRVVYTPEKFNVILPLSSTSQIFIKAMAVQNSENSVGHEVGKGNGVAGQTQEEDSVAQERKEILGGKEQHV